MSGPGEYSDAQRGEVASQPGPAGESWAWVTAGATRWQVNRVFATPAFLRRLAAPELLMAPPATPVREDSQPRATHLVRMTLPEFPSAPVIIKLYRRQNPWQFLKESLRRTRARRAFELAFVLIKSSIPTAKPIAAGPLRRGAWRSESYLLSEEVSPACRLRELRACAGDGLRGRRLMRALARTMARLHEAGLSHRDPSLSNFLVRNETGASPELVVIDLDGLRAHRRVSWRRAEKDLRRVFSRIQMTPRERLWFLAQYSRCRFARPPARNLVDRMGAKP